MAALFADKARRPLYTFALASLVLIAIMVAASGYVQSRFFEDALIEREAEIVRQMVVALVQHELHAEDFDDYASAASQQRFDQAFSALKKIPEVVRLKLYNPDNVIVWSDAKDLVGKFLPKTDEHLARVWAGIPSDVFDPAKRPSHSMDPLPSIMLVEFYVPVAVGSQGAQGREIKAAVAVYRSAKEMTDTLQRGMVLLWLVIATGGVLLFFALFYQFRSIYYRERDLEERFHKLHTEHERAEEAAAGAKAKFDTLFDSVADAILIVSMQGRFIHVNSSACERLGYSYEEMLQMGPADIDAPEYIEKVPERIRTIMECGQLVFETVQMHKDGTRIPLELHARLIRFGGERAIMSVARDLTERKRMESDLHQAKEAAEHALAEQRQLVAMISHEYRSPLAVIDSAAQLLNLKLPPESGAAPILARIRRGVTRLTSFLDNCLIEGRMESENLTLYSSDIDLYELSESVMESALNMSENHRLVAELDPGLPALEGDYQLLSVMLLNLLGNAIKYSSGGSEVRLRVRRHGQAVSFEVIDQGCGIPPDELPLVTRKYVRGSSAASIPGAGLGLSLVGKIVAMHGGSLEIRSREGEGTHVTVIIPQHAAFETEKTLQTT